MAVVLLEGGPCDGDRVTMTGGQPKLRIHVIGDHSRICVYRMSGAPGVFQFVCEEESKHGRQAA